jgi:hypothetical protein
MTGFVASIADGGGFEKGRQVARCSGVAAAPPTTVLE